MIDLMAFAYSLHPDQITGFPAWLETEKYDLQAEAKTDGTPIRVLVQNLIADRFALTFHRDSKKLTVYAISVAKTGPKFLASTGDPAGNPGFGFPGRGAMVVKNGGIADFAGWLQRYVLDRPVIDKTEIRGKYNFELKWMPDEFQFRTVNGQLPPADPNTDRPDLFTAMQQQLGLKLESTKADIDILVIDHVERPSEN